MLVITILVAYVRDILCCQSKIIAKLPNAPSAAHWDPPKASAPAPAWNSL